jgi:hypothetical protein
VAKNKDDIGLSILLEMDGEVFPMDNGYWTKFSIKKVGPDAHIPHGIKYSLTLHDRNNKRIVGYDNAHGVKPRKRKYAGKRLVWDHKHNKEKIRAYEFESPGQLMEDFWKDVNGILEN